MKLKRNIKNLTLELICLLYVSLFVYAAVSKILEFENFQAQLGQSPILGAYAGFLSYFVIITELAVALLLVFSKTRILALYAAFELMVLFTVYIIIILNFSYTIPCSCGGVLENMGWKEHLAFNIFFVFLAVIATVLNSVHYNKTMLKLFVLTISGSLIMSLLYFRSENIIHKENPFIRRFTPGSSKKIAETKLHNNTLYIAGTDQNSIYIGDQRAPLHIFKYDSTLKVKKHYKIELENAGYSFRSVQVRISPPYFFVMDGTVPIIYRGKISDWKAEILMKDSGYYFSKAVVIDSLKIAFRTQLEKSRENALGVFNFKNSLKSNLHQDLLQKQIDGFFDTDGMMNYDSETKSFVYLYYYRNQFIVTDNNLKLRYRGNTIDTTKTANLKPVFIKDKGQRKLSSPDNIVNKLSTIRDNFLFVNSSLRGRFEPKEMWDTATIVDVYDTDLNSYLSSIYIYKVEEFKMKDMIVLGNNLYVIVGQNLQCYKLDKDLKTNQHKNISGR